MILLLSGTTITWAHHGLLENDRKTLVTGLGLTVLLVVRQSFVGIASAARQPAWLWTGGALSAFIVLAITVGPPRIGVTATVGTVIAGNLVMSALIDRFGWLGNEQIALNWSRLLGIALLAVGAALTLRK